METEKITVNLGGVDLGNIDLLVEQGFYSNRSDFIRTAIRNQLQTHSVELKKITAEKVTAIGVAIYTQRNLEDLQKLNKKVDICLVGMLIIEKDVSPELARATFQNVKVYGILRATDEIKKIIMQ